MGCQLTTVTTPALSAEWKKVELVYHFGKITLTNDIWSIMISLEGRFTLCLNFLLN